MLAAGTEEEEEEEKEHDSLKLENFRSFFYRN